MKRCQPVVHVPIDDKTAEQMNTQKKSMTDVSVAKQH